MAIIGVSVVLAGCDAPTERRHPQAVEAPSAGLVTATAETDNDQNESATAALPTDGPLGVSSARLPEQRVRHANRHALRLHRRENFESALQSFSEVVDAHPEYTVARFNQACALARLGRYRKAAELLVAVLRQDYSGYADRIANDDDLRDFMSSEFGASYGQAKQAILRRYRQALTLGVPVSTRRVENGRSLVRAGVYMHAENRFVPMARSVRSDRDDLDADTVPSVSFVVSSLDQHTKTILSIEGNQTAEDIPHLFGASIIVTEAATGQEILRVPSTSHRCVKAVAHQSSSVFSFVDESNSMAKSWLLHSADATEPRLVQVSDDPFATKPRGRDLQPALAEATARPHLFACTDPDDSPELGLIRTTAEGYAIRRNQLITPGGDSRSLGRGYGVARMRNVYQHLTRPVAVTVAVTGFFSGMGDGGQHLASVVFLDTKEAVRLSTGTAPMHFRFGADDALYVQVGDPADDANSPPLRRFDLSARTWDDTMEGLWLL